MLTIFNRKELITVLSQQKLFRIREALSNAGIPSHTKTIGAMGRGFGRGHGTPFCDHDAAYTYRIYVHQDDYDRAVQAIQSALREV